MHETSQPTTKAGIDLDRIRGAITPALARHKVSLVDIEWLTERAGWTLRLTIERDDAVAIIVPGGAGPIQAGVNLEDCADVSRDVSALLDEHDLIPQHYNLEVSSPGLDRKLRGAADFARFLGQTAKVKLKRPAPDGQRLLRGVIAAAASGTIAVVVDGKRIEAPLEDVEEARLGYELSPQPKPVKGAKGAKRGSSARPRKEISGKAPHVSKRR